MYVTAIIAAGGRGERIGGSTPKQLLSVGGLSILERIISTFLVHPLIDHLVVALPEDLANDPPEYLTAASKPVRIVPGGARRQESVSAAFRAIPKETDVVVVHDAARPFASATLIERTVTAATQFGAALAALPVRDTVKQAAGGLVAATLDRSSIFLAQTPQAFRTGVLRDALARGGEGTDEASLVEQTGHPVHIVDGEASNIKITTRDDLTLAEAIAGGARPARTGRAGLGYDLHRLVEGRPLILGGVTIPCDRGPLGHSDADALCHAITDAVLGAAGVGDIGGHFPDTDPRWQGASSLGLLKRAVEIVRERGLDVGNIDAIVVLERPKLAPHVAAMRGNLAAALAIPIDRVSIKGKTNEGIGELGRGEAIAVHAIALVRQGTS